MNLRCRTCLPDDKNAGASGTLSICVTRDDIDADREFSETYTYYARGLTTRVSN